MDSLFDAYFIECFGENCVPSNFYAMKHADYHHIRDKDAVKTIKNNIDSLLVMEKRNQPWCSDFLTPVECREIKRTLSHVHLIEYPQDSWSERHVLLYEAKPEEQLTILRILWEQGEIGHRDVLGSLLEHTERSHIGDIVVKEGSGEVLLHKETAELLLFSWTHVGKTPIKIESKNSLTLETPTQNTKIKRGSVASLRLDAVLAEICHLSREGAKRLVLSKKVKMNHCICQKVDVTVSEGDLFSIRGLGRVRLLHITGKTRKGRVWIEYEYFL